MIRGEEQRSARSLVGDRIRDRRLELGLTQRELSRRTGITAVSVSIIERGARDVCLDALTRIAKALDLPLAALLGEVIPPSETAIEFGRALDEGPPDLAAAFLVFLRSALRAELAAAARRK